MHDTGRILDPTILTFGLLFVAALVSIVTRRLRFPISVALTLVGLALDLMARALGATGGLLGTLGVTLSHDLILFIFLPTLVFESAYNLPVRQVLRNLAPILTLAVPGLVLSTAIVGVALAWALDLGLLPALLFGALISATDPVAVIALFKDLGAPKRLVTLVEGESLFNDATAIVVFGIVLEVLSGATGSALGAITSFVWVFLGGTTVGGLLGVVFARVIERVRDDELVEITLTTVLAYLSFIIADHTLHVSGVMATVAAGMVLASYGRTKISPPVVRFMNSFWEYMAYVANSLIFLLVGLYLPATFNAAGSLGLIGAILLSVAVAFAARAAAVFGMVPVLGRLGIADPIDRPYQAVIFWGGLRGAIALALALSLLESPHLPAGVGEYLLALTAGVVLFTLTVNALTVGRLVRWFGLDRQTGAERVLKVESMIEVQAAVEERLEELRSEAILPPRVVDKLIEQRRRRRVELETALGQVAMSEPERLDLHRIECLGIEKTKITTQFAAGNLSELATRDLGHETDVRIDRIRYGWWVDAGASRDRLRQALLVIARRLPFGGLAQRLETARVAEVYELARGRFLAAREVLAELDRRLASGALGEADHGELSADYRRRLSDARDEMDVVAAQFPEYVARVQELLGARLALNVEREGYSDLRDRGVLTETLHRQLAVELEERFAQLAQQPIAELDLSPRALLAAVPLCRGLVDEDLDQVAELLQPRSCVKGEVLFREGEHGDRLYIIGRGVVRVWRGSGPEATPLATLGAGDVVGEMALLHPAPRTASAMTATVARLLELRQADLELVLTTYPTIREGLERAYQERRAALTARAAPR